MSKIKNIYAREILDSRGNPTVEVELTLESGIKAVASVPSGASTGKNEALELRDNDKNRYHGKGVLKAINNVNNIIKPLLIGKDSLNQEEIDRIMLEKDGTENKEVLGANAILGVSLANLKAAAKYKGLELYEYLGKEYSMPRCMMNILNGGVHASNNLDFQEFMIVPNKEEYHENLRMGSEVFNTLKNVLKERNLLCGVGDEGGFAPQINDAKEALELIKEAITKSGYELGKDINIALDVAASEFYNEEEDIYLLEGVKYTKEELVSYYQSLVDKYHIISIEDGMAEEDYEGWKLLTSKLSNIQLVGDDLFVTNKKLLQKGIDMHIANAILIKLNQIGTVTETLETIKLARDNNYKTIISHRSGETEDNYISDFAVGLNLGQIKTGSMSRGERLSKYNRLLRIEEQIKWKKLVVLIIPILLLTACTSNEEDKIAYLEYKNELEKQETFSPEDELDFNVYFNISKEGEEITNYSILINNPKVNMHKVKALLIHNYIIDEAYPSIGIMDKPVELLKDNNNKIELKGKIQTSENISNVKYKLYIEYTTDDGKENKIYYDVKRG